MNKDDLKDDILEEEDEDIIELEDENGEKLPYRVIASAEYKNHEYIMLQPCFELEDNDVVMIFRVHYNENEDIELMEIESEEEEKAVFEEFKLILGEEDYEFEE